MKIKLKRSSVLEGGKAKEPTPAQMEYGELAVNYNASDPSVFIKDSNNQIVKISENNNDIGDGSLTLKSFGTGDSSTGTFTANQTGSSDITLPQISYTDLKDVPPNAAAPGNGALTIETAGEGASSTGTFTANQAGASTLTLPTIRYEDLSGRPAIGNGTITIKQPGTSDQAFTVNQSGNTEINLKNDNTNTTYTASNGVLLTGTNFTADTTVVRTTGDQNIGGNKRFTQSVDCFNAEITGFGDNAVGIAIGKFANAKRTTATQNVAVGFETLSENTTGNNNTAIGVQSLWKGTAPRNCVAVGQLALSQNNEQNCVAVGKSAAQLSNAASTTAIGSSTLNALTTGTNNTSIGFSSALALTSGSNNVSIGVGSMQTASISERNVAVGPQSLSSLTEGSQNVAIGDRAGITLTTGNNNICIGKEGNGLVAVFEGTTESNYINMGNRNITDAYVRVAWTVVSDERDKTNFKTVPHGLDFVNKLKPISYQFKLNRTSDKSTGSIRYGFKAQDILELEGDNPVVIDNKDENLLKYKGEHLVPILVNAIQELSQELDELKKSLPVK